MNKLIFGIVFFVTSLSLYSLDKTDNFIPYKVIGLSNGKHILIVEHNNYIPKSKYSENLNDIKFKIYPNPIFNDNAIIEFESSENTDITIYTYTKFMKKEILCYDKINIGNNKIPISLDGYDKGLLILFIKMNGIIYTIKAIII